MEVILKKCVDFENSKAKSLFSKPIFQIQKAFFHKKQIVDRFFPENPRTSTEFGDSAGDV